MRDMKISDDKLKPCPFCGGEASRDLGCECGTAKAFDWAFDYGRHGDDDCQCPDEWFVEG